MGLFSRYAERVLAVVAGRDEDMKGDQIELELCARLAERASRRFCILTGSGTASIIVALRALGGDLREVVVPALSCPALFTAPNMAGFHSVVADVDLATFGMRRSETAAVQTSRTSVIIPVHPFGTPTNFEDLERLTSDLGIMLLEDACLGFGASITGRPIGSFGPLSVTSFGYDKLLSIGEGGAIFTDDQSLFEACAALTSANPLLTFDVVAKGALLLERLSKLDTEIATRRSHSLTYHDGLRSRLVIKPEFECDPPLWRYTCRFMGDRKRLIAAARERGLFISHHYHSLHVFRSGCERPVAERISPQLINLPITPDLTTDQRSKTIELINDFR